jgi:hypothetical protein
MSAELSELGWKPDCATQMTNLSSLILHHHFMLHQESTPESDEAVRMKLD